MILDISKIYFAIIYKQSYFYLSMGFRKKKSKGNEVPEGPVRIKIPRGREVIGVINQRVGGSRMIVNCMDGKTRNGKVPGRLRRGMWLREGDIIIVVPWEFDDDKAEIMYKYSKAQVEKLKRDGLLKMEEEEF